MRQSKQSAQHQQRQQHRGRGRGSDNFKSTTSSLTLLPSCFEFPDPPLQLYTMCSEKEVQERRKMNDGSIFERDVYNQKIDPARIIAKYSRSAAGVDSSRYTPRTMGQLQQTVDYLMRLFVTFLNQQQDTTQSSPSLLLSLIHFMEDRIRAVQKEMVISRLNSKQLQWKLVQWQVVVLYLTLDCPAYQKKFGMSALQTALTSYWNDDQSNSIELDDAILSCSLLVTLNQHLQQQVADTDSYGSAEGSNLSTELATYRKHVPHQRHDLHLFKWTLQLTEYVLLGHWQTALQFLATAETSSLLPSASLFGILARCCLAPSIPFIRWKILETWNFAFQKGHCIPSREVARLLQFQNDSDSAATALGFGRSAGLPFDNNDDNNCEGYLLFKTVPVQPLPENMPLRDDAFVLLCPAKAATLDQDGRIMAIPRDALEKLGLLLLGTSSQKPIFRKSGVS